MKYYAKEMPFKDSFTDDFDYNRDYKPYIKNPMFVFRGRITPQLPNYPDTLVMPYKEFDNLCQLWREKGGKYELTSFQLISYIDKRIKLSQREIWKNDN